MSPRSEKIYFFLWHIYLMSFGVTMQFYFTPLPHLGWTKVMVLDLKLMTTDKETLWLARVCVNHCYFRSKQDKLDLLIVVTGNNGGGYCWVSFGIFLYPFIWFSVTLEPSENPLCLLCSNLLFLFFLYVLDSLCKIQHIHTCACIHIECMSTCNANIGFF